MRMFPLLVAVLVGCVPPPFPEDRLPAYEERPVEATFSAGFGAVWEAAVQVVSEAYPVARVDRDSGLVLTEWVTEPSDTIYTSFAGTRIPEKVRFQLRLEVRAAEGGVEVRVTSHEQVEKDVVSANLDFTGSVVQWLDVPSSTRRERRIVQEMLDLLERRAQAGGTEG